MGLYNSLLKDTTPPLSSTPKDVPSSEAKTVKVHKTTSRGVGETTKPQVVKSTIPQSNKTTSNYIKSRLKAKTTSIQTGKKVEPLPEKYTTHLRPETVKKIKLQAVLTDQKDYEIVQAALDKYLER